MQEKRVFDIKQQDTTIEHAYYNAMAITGNFDHPPKVPLTSKCNTNYLVVLEGLN